MIRADGEGLPVLFTESSRNFGGQERACDFDVAGGMERLVLHFREVARG